MEDQVLQVDVTVLAFIAGSIIPLVTALATKLRASSKVKSIFTLVLSLVSGAVIYLQQNDGKVTAFGLATAVIATYLSAGVTYQNFLKPTGIATAVSNTSPDTGLGAPTETPVEPLTEEKVAEVAAETFDAAVTLAEEQQGQPTGREDAERLTTLKGTPVFVDDDGTLFVKVA